VRETGLPDTLGATREVALKEGEKTTVGHHDEAVSEFQKAISLDHLLREGTRELFSTQRL